MCHLKHHHDPIKVIHNMPLNTTGIEHSYQVFKESPMHRELRGEPTRSHWSRLCFLARFEFHVLMLEIERWFSYFPSVVSKSLKSHHASGDGYHTLKASSTFRSNNFPPFFYLGISYVGCYRSHSSQVPNNETAKSLLKFYPGQ
jgi:hypothetical protein